MRIITEFNDFLAMQAAAQNMSKEEYTAYYLSEGKVNTIKFKGKKVDISTLEVDGVDSRDYPDFVDSFFSYGEYTNGKELSDSELSDFTDENLDLCQEMAMESFH